MLNVTLIHTDGRPSTTQLEPLAPDRHRTRDGAPSWPAGVDYIRARAIRGGRQADNIIAAYLFDTESETLRSFTISKFGTVTEEKS